MSLTPPAAHAAQPPEPQSKPAPLSPITAHLSSPSPFLPRPQTAQQIESARKRNEAKHQELLRAVLGGEEWKYSVDAGTGDEELEYLGRGVRGDDLGWRNLPAASLHHQPFKLAPRSSNNRLSRSTTHRQSPLLFLPRSQIASQISNARKRNEVKHQELVRGILRGEEWKYSVDAGTGDEELE